ncbi:MAG: hypothetical protein ABIT37_09465 [Luteolibacter sp.]
MKHLTLPVLAILSAAAVSCASAHPHRASASQPAVRGQLVDAKTSAPVAKQPVQITVDGQQFKRTSSPQGGFRIPLAKIQHDVRSDAKVTVDCDGYQRRTINWTRLNDPTRKSPETANVNLGTIRLEKR